jgi:ribA/ribD-fused uncharacterized protein
MKPITKFDGPFRFLSNFWPVQIEHKGVLFCSVEHAYQAAKFDDEALILRIANTLKPGDAKRLGRLTPARVGWDAQRLPTMETLLRKKFAKTHPELRVSLRLTEDALLVEGNFWHDTFWGVDQHTGEGENHLGKLLMKIRRDLQNEETR